MSSSNQKSVIVLVLYGTYIQTPTSMLCYPMGSESRYSVICIISGNVMYTLIVTIYTVGII
jgi:hypothetical protein